MSRQRTEEFEKLNVFVGKWQAKGKVYPGEGIPAIETKELAGSSKRKKNTSPDSPPTMISDPPGPIAQDEKRESQSREAEIFQSPTFQHLRIPSRVQLTARRPTGENANEIPPKMRCSKSWSNRPRSISHIFIVSSSEQLTANRPSPDTAKAATLRYSSRLEMWRIPPPNRRVSRSLDASHSIISLSWQAQ